LGILKTIGLLVVEGIFLYTLNQLLDPIKGFILNKFTSQNFPINDFIATIGIITIIGATAIGVLLILQFRNYLVNKSLDIVIPNKTPNEKLDELIQEIENFTTKWQEGSGVKSGYRTWVEKNWFVGDKNQIRKFLEHGTNIHIKINPVKKLGISELDSALNCLVEVTDRLVKLLLEMKGNYWNMDKSKVILASDPEIPKRIISDGDKICDDLESSVNQLHLLRKYLL